MAGETIYTLLFMDGQVVRAQAYENEEYMLWKLIVDGFKNPLTKNILYGMYYKLEILLI